MSSITFITWFHQPNAVDKFRVDQPMQMLQSCYEHVNKSHAFSLINGRLRGRGLRETSDIVVFKSPVWIQPFVQQQIQIARDHGQLIVCDLDDDVFNLDPTHLSYQTYSKFIDKEYLLEELFDHVIVSTPALAGYANNTHVIKNMIDIESYSTRSINKQVATIGYFGDLHHHQNDLTMLSPWLNKWIKQHNVNFIHLGNDKAYEPVTKIINVAPQYITTINYIPIGVWPVNLYSNAFDISLIPLQDNKFNWAKSNLKGMESCAVGMPFIATPVGEYLAWGQGVVAPIEQWADRLTQMLDYDYRVELQQQAYAALKLEDIRVRWRDWLEFFDKIAA